MIAPVIRPHTPATAADLQELVRRARLTRLCHIIHQLLTNPEDPRKAQP